jgi:2-oxoacid:acceptor oxidoreductase gamma subunit (pyruvate/2-ketoisovalerate family)
VIDDLGDAIQTVRKKDMVGIRFHGRGGQGAVVASKILAHAYFKQGLYVQAFPSFGMERKGAAVSAFVRLDDAPIVERGEIKNPSAVIVLDSSLLRKVDVAHGARPDALILLNCRENENQNPVAGPFRVAGVDAVKIALQHGLGSKTAPIINTVILGAYARVSGDLSLANLLSAIETGVPVNQKQNMAAAEAAYQAVFWISGEVNAN